MRALLLLFIVIPIVEMWVLIEVGARIGALPTIALVFLTAIVGLALLRQQGFSTLLRVNRRMEEGQLPAGEILEGVLLAIGGALLLTPGFVTDAIGFACLIPPSRKAMVAALLRHSVVMATYGRQGGGGAPGSTHTGYRGTGYRDSHRDRGKTIEGEYHRDD